LKSIIQFCFEILNSLLICKNSNSNVKTKIEYDNRLDSIEVISNDMRVKQILLNFISNSVKFTKSGFIEIKVQLKIKNDKKYIKISVIDSGVGIREEDQKKKFNEIYTDIKNESNGHGSGLGLNICKFIAEKLNHSLKFKSIYGKGSKFSLVISESCMKLDKNNQYNFNLKKIEFTNFNKSNTEKFENVIQNSKFKELIQDDKCEKNKKDNLFLNFKTIKNLRRKSYDTTILSKKIINIKESLMDYEKINTSRDVYINDKYNISINYEDKTEILTLRNDNPLIFKYSNQFNRNYSFEKNSNNQNLNVSINSYSNSNN